MLMLQLGLLQLTLVLYGFQLTLSNFCYNKLTSQLGNNHSLTELSERENLNYYLKLTIFYEKENFIWCCCRYCSVGKLY